ncbi:MAG: fibronectin type III domain-containing protein [Deltaproteobacteria bacterium]|nr:fibronectin type III domain-containing protein [Deltaproteobacteria bacterium]
MGKSCLLRIGTFIIVFQLILALLLSGCKEDNAAQTGLQAESEGSTAPAVSDGTIAISSVGTESLMLSWKSASDDISQEKNLTYLVYRSKMNSLSTITGTETYGSAVGDYTANISLKIITGLNNSTTYYFNIITKDEANNKALYTTTSATTLDATAPTVTDGTLTVSDQTTDSLVLNWTKALENVIPQQNLLYLAYQSSSNNIDTVSNIETNGSGIGSFSADITSKTVTGLSSATAYYYNVIVKDGTGNKSAFNMKETGTAISGTWSFKDGAAADGINYDTTKAASKPHLASYNSKLYATWYESNGTNTQIRVAEWDNASSWIFKDGNAANGINKATAQDATNPWLTVFNAKLYAAWQESNGSNSQIRIAEWDNTSSWSFKDGDGSNGINKSTSQNAASPHMIVFNSKLYTAWQESNGTKTQIRVAEWDGTSSWSFKDGDGSGGINKSASQNATNPFLSVFNSKLYATWQESDSTADQIRVAEWDGSSSWTFRDGNGDQGINKFSAQSASNPQLITFNAKLYAIWNEGATGQIRVAEWDGSATWRFKDGDGVNGINKSAVSIAESPFPIDYHGILYAVWEEKNSNLIDQIRIAEWDRSTTWTFKDGNGTNGINKEPAKAAISSRLVVFNSKLYMVWSELGTIATQIRVAEAQ